MVKQKSSELSVAHPPALDGREKLRFVKVVPPFSHGGLALMRFFFASFKVSVLITIAKILQLNQYGLNTQFRSQAS